MLGGLCPPNIPTYLPCHGDSHTLINVSSLWPEILENMNHYPHHFKRSKYCSQKGNQQIDYNKKGLRWIFPCN
jgi:hypothetical protein